MAEYIEREAFKAEVRRLSTHYLNEWDTLGVLAAADRIPAADVRPVVRGEWEQENIVLTSYPPQYQWHCSECGEIKYGFNDGVLTNFCPNCGADMGEES